VAARKRHQQPSAAQTLDQIESSGDKLVQWVLDNPVTILGTLVGVLLIAGVWGISRDLSVGEVDDSSAALALAQEQFLAAMGSTPTSLEVNEPANPETARQVRSEYVGRFEAVASEHAGSTAAALAQLEAGKLLEALDDVDAAIAHYEAGLDDVDPDNAARGMLYARIGAAHESAGRWLEAAAAYEAAAGVAGYVIAPEALADAARSFIHAGERDRALETQARLEAEAPSYRLSPYLKAQLEELRDEPQAD
jgi:hypothetical protein